MEVGYLSYALAVNALLQNTLILSKAKFLYSICVDLPDFYSQLLYFWLPVSTPLVRLILLGTQDM